MVNVLFRHKRMHIFSRHGSVDGTYENGKKPDRTEVGISVGYHDKQLTIVGILVFHLFLQLPIQRLPAKNGKSN